MEVQLNSQAFSTADEAKCWMMVAKETAKERTSPFQCHGSAA
jgi:hypothetical protein